MNLLMSIGRLATFQAAVIGAGLVIVSTPEIWPLRLLYNASASMPLGWYGVGDPDPIAVGDLVVAMPPPRVERLLVERGYLGAGVPILKVVVAREGHCVCRDDDTVTVDAVMVGLARDSDDAGRPLPRWSGCRQLGPGELFLLNRAAQGSFDSRYFGPVSVSSIIGKATPLWTW